MITKRDTDLAVQIIDELESARKQHIMHFASLHEGYAVLKEEVDELWDAIKNKKEDKQEQKKQIRQEAIQVAAMAMRLILDCIDPPPSSGEFEKQAN